MAVGVFFFFFFQAEDGIRDYKVTGVQTCALPISGLAKLDEPRRGHNGQLGQAAEHVVGDRLALALDRDNADGRLVHTHRELRGVHGRVARAGAYRAVRAYPAVHVCGGALRAVVERVAAEERADLVVGRHAVAVRDLVAAAVVQRQRERRGLRHLGEDVAEDPSDVTHARRGGDGVADGVAIKITRRLRGAFGARDALGERALELATPCVKTLFVAETLALGQTLVIHAALIEALLEALLPVEEHLLDALDDVVGGRAALVHRTLDAGASLIGPLPETALFLIAARAHPLGDALLFLEADARDRLLDERLGLAETAVELILEDRLGRLGVGLVADDREARRRRRLHTGWRGSRCAERRGHRLGGHGLRRFGEGLLELDAVGEARARHVHRIVGQGHGASLVAGLGVGHPHNGGSTALIPGRDECGGRAKNPSGRR